MKSHFQTELVELLGSVGNRVNKNDFQRLARESGLCSRFSDAEKIAREDHRMIGAALSHETIVVNGIEIRSILNVNDELGETLLLHLTNDNLEEMCKQYPDDILHALKRSEREENEKAIAAQGKSWDYQHAQGVLFPHLERPVIETIKGDSQVEEDLRKAFQKLEPEIKHHQDIGYERVGQYTPDFVWKRYNTVIEVDSYEHHFQRKAKYHKTLERDHYYISNGHNLKVVHARKVMSEGAEEVAKYFIRAIESTGIDQLDEPLESVDLENIDQLEIDLGIDETVSKNSSK